MSQSLYNKLIVAQPVKKYYGVQSVLPHLEDPFTGPYSEQDDSVQIIILCLFQTNFNIILPSTPKSPKQCLSFGSSD
jgi:hypothetical protein